MRAIDSLGLEDKVTMMNYSEFGRTLVDNGSGADHAWGNSYFVVGGAVKGGNYGVMPEMDPNADHYKTRVYLSQQPPSPNTSQRRLNGLVRVMRISMQPLKSLKTSLQVYSAICTHRWGITLPFFEKGKKVNIKFCFGKIH
jgi:hypothetical protein